MTREAIKSIQNGMYFLHPEGGCWIGAKFCGGVLVGRIAEANAAIHAAAGDHYDGCVPDVDDVDVTPYESDMIVAEVMGENIDASCVIVQRSYKLSPGD